VTSEASGGDDKRRAEVTLGWRSNHRISVESALSVGKAAPPTDYSSRKEGSTRQKIQKAYNDMLDCALTASMNIG